MPVERVIVSIAFMIPGIAVVFDLLYKLATNKDLFNLTFSHLTNAIFSFMFVLGLAMLFPHVLYDLASAIAISFASFGVYSISKACLNYKIKREAKNTTDDERQ